MQDQQEQDGGFRRVAPEEHYWQWLLHEDDLFSNRANFFIVAETMIFIAFAINTYSNLHLTRVFGAAGILFATIWLYVSFVQIFFLLNPIKKKLRAELIEYREINVTWYLGDPNIWLGMLFPLVLVGIWTFLLVQE